MILEILYDVLFCLFLVMCFYFVVLVINDFFVGLVVYIMEKFVVWSGCSLISDIVICLEFCFIKDELLMNVMIYWIIYLIVFFMRFYYEIMYRYEFCFVLR